MGKHARLPVSDRTVAFVKAAKHRGTTAAALAEAEGIGIKAAGQRLYEARARLGGIDAHGRGASAMWVADEFRATFVRLRERRYYLRQLAVNRRWWAAHVAGKVRQRIVAANDAQPLKVAAPRSVFDLGRMEA